MTLVNVRRGRPQKFSRPARTVTMTLPEDVIRALTELDSDLSRAVVRLVMPLNDKPVSPAAEVATFGTRAVIIVPPSQLLAAMPGVELVPLADGRALIALEEHVGLSDFELLVRDMVEQQDVDAKERPLLSEITAILRQGRRDARLTLRRILFLQARPPRSPARTTTRSR
jgi:hypothetical protein